MDFEKINASLNTVIMHNTLRDYLQAAMLLAGLMVLFVFLKWFLVSYLGKLAKRTVSDFDDFIVSLFSQISIPAFFVIALYLSTLSLTLSVSLHVLIKYLMIIVVTMRVVLILQAMLKYGLGMAYRRHRAKDDPSVEPIIASLTGILKWGIWIFALIFVLDNMGVNISTLVAGIGIGGIAVAIASQAILGDAFSAFCIFLDKPFEIGDFIILDGDNLGTVEHVGIKTTRIRSLSGEELVLANSDLTKSRIKNYKRMQTRRIDFTIGVAYDTPPEKVRQIPGMIKDIIGQIKGIQIDRAHFQSFGEASLIFEVVYFVNSADYNLYMDYQQQINIALMEHFQSAGIMFAQPVSNLLSNLNKLT